MSIEGNISNRGQLAASYAVRGTHVPTYSVGLPDGNFLIGPGQLRFNGGAWNNGIGSWAGGFLTPPGSGWFQYYIDVASILAGPPATSFSITPRSLSVGNVSDPQPTTPFPTNSFPLALLQCNGSIKSLIDMRPLPAGSFETINLVIVSEPVINVLQRAEFIDNFDICQAQLSVPFQANYPEIVTSTPVVEVGLALFTPLQQYRLGPFGAANGRIDCLGIPYQNPPRATSDSTASGEQLPSSLVWGVSGGRLINWAVGSTQPGGSFALFRQDVNNQGQVALLTDMRPAAVS